MRKRIPILFCLILAIAGINPATATPLGGSARILDPAGNQVIDQPITGDLDLAANTMTVEPFPFFGSAFVTNSVELLGEGTYTRPGGSTGPDITATVGPGQQGAYVTIVWNVSEFPTFMVWDVSPHAAGQVYTTVDSDGDGIPGHALVSGPFPGFSVVYDFTVGEPAPDIEVAITIPGGDNQECSQTGGSPVVLNADVDLIGGTTLASVTWFVDGASAGTGTSITPFLTLESHTIEVLATTTTGESSSATATVTIVDRAPPQVDAAFVDRRTGEILNDITGPATQFVITRFSATDICDPEPVTQGVLTPVHAVNNGETLRIQGNNTVELPTSAVELSVTAKDASGNTRSGQAVLVIAD
jgi:hypothetical protein